MSSTFSDFNIYYKGHKLYLSVNSQAGIICLPVCCVLSSATQLYGIKHYSESVNEE